MDRLDVSCVSVTHLGMIGGFKAQVCLRGSRWLLRGLVSCSSLNDSVVAIVSESDVTIDDIIGLFLLANTSAQSSQFDLACCGPLLQRS